LRALGKGGAIEALTAEIETNLSAAKDPGLARPVEAVRAALAHATSWIATAMSAPDRLEAGARRFALTLGRSLELALLAGHAQWCVANHHAAAARMAAAARRFAQNGVDLVADAPLEDTRLLS
ncbi:MAG TPA: acyl-CoA dehydrogenase, partial [Kofleriaceae bacterium]|nr:acyl-CoA dehydrogenase [Kofleriaceae bacterium]